MSTMQERTKNRMGAVRDHLLRAHRVALGIKSDQVAAREIESILRKRYSRLDGTNILIDQNKKDLRQGVERENIDAQIVRDERVAAGVSNDPSLGRVIELTQNDFANVGTQKKSVRRVGDDEMKKLLEGEAEIAEEGGKRRVGKQRAVKGKRLDGGDAKKEKTPLRERMAFLKEVGDMSWSEMEERFGGVKGMKNVANNVLKMDVQKARGGAEVLGTKMKDEALRMLGVLEALGRDEEE